MSEQPTRALAPAVDAEARTCPSCGAPVADDQRYCLACGTRRPEARLPFLDVLRTAPEPAAVAPAPGRWQAQLPLAALSGLALIALLIGVLLGHWAAGPAQVRPAAAGAQQIRVITVTAPAAAAPAPAAPAPAPSPAAPAHKRRKAAAVTPPGATNRLRDLQHLSGKAYQRQIDKLGKKISTGGKPPPKDHKAPAGGGSFQDIG